MKVYDVLVIGAGVIGCAVARELSKYRLSICVIEKESDVCEGTSKANSGIVHAGFDAATGTLKAKLNVRGSNMIPELSKQLDFAYNRNGAMVLCFDEAETDGLKELYDRGIANGVEGLSIITGEEARKIEPSLSENVAGALLAETSGVVCPFEMTIAFAENAYANGAEFIFNTEVKNIAVTDSGYSVETDNGVYETGTVINCAGVYADKIHNMVCDKKTNIIPRRGEYYLLDKEAGNLISKTLFQMPTKMGKGVLVTPTVHGNILAGPTAVNIEDKDDTATTSDGLGFIKEKAGLSVKNIPFNKAITNFSGLRAVGETGDFIIEESRDGFIDVLGIESPGLSSAPAIGEYVAEIFGKKRDLTRKENFIETRTGVKHFALLTREEQNEIIKENPAYGSIVCRCETVTEGEILDAINRPLGATTIDGVKRRTRAGMGRCQAGFCSPKVMALIAESCGIALGDVKKH